MNISNFFIDRPIFAGVLSFIIFLGGLISLTTMPVSEYPDVVPPSIVVRAQYPGANPKVIAETVATPIEEQINGVEGMLYMGSQATADGQMTLTVTFALGTDPDKAQQLVQNRVSQAEPRLPEEVRSLGITTVKSSPDLMLVVNLISPNDRYDITYLRNYALINIKDRLARINGVGDVQLFGSGDYSMRIWLDPQKTAELGLSATDVLNEIRAQNVQAAAGTIGASPNSNSVDLQLSVNAQGRLQIRRRIRPDHRQDCRQWRDHTFERHCPHRTWRSRLFATLAARQQELPSLSRSSRHRAPMRSRSPMKFVPR